ncbi:MAG: hypothetical protein ACQETD_09590 [Pseudomonadota bacterium]
MGRWRRYGRITERTMYVVAIVLVVFIIWSVFFNGPPHERVMMPR